MLYLQSLYLVICSHVFKEGRVSENMLSTGASTCPAIIYLFILIYIFFNCVVSVTKSLFRVLQQLHQRKGMCPALQFTALPYTFMQTLLHYFGTLQLITLKYTKVHPTLLHCKFCTTQICILIKYKNPHCTVLHCISLHCITLHCTTLY